VSIVFSTVQYSTVQYVWLYDGVQARPRMQRMSVIASLKKCARRGSVRVSTRLVSLIGSGPRLLVRVGSGVRVSYSFHTLNCAVVRAVVRSGFRDTLTRWQYPLYVCLFVCSILAWNAYLSGTGPLARVAQHCWRSWAAGAAGPVPDILMMAGAYCVGHSGRTSLFNDNDSGRLAIYG